jgi:TetR/AcrR family transcriptional repressor of lmrAB and yxaGH operons
MWRMTRTDERPTKERIVRAARRLLAVHGYEGTGLKELSETAKAPYGSIYFHFPGGKDEVVATAVRSAGHDRAAAFAAELSDGAPGTAIEAWFRRTAKALEDVEYVGGCVVGTPSLDAAASSDIVRAACDEAFASWIDAIATSLREHGVTRARARELASTVMASFEGALMLARAQRSPDPLLAAGKVMRQVVDEAQARRTRSSRAPAR